MSEDRVKVGHLKSGGSVHIDRGGRLTTGDGYRLSGREERQVKRDLRRAGITNAASAKKARRAYYKKKR